MKSKRIKIIVAALALMLLAAVAVSQTVRRAHMRGPGMFGRTHAGISSPTIWI